MIIQKIITRLLFACLLFSANSLKANCCYEYEEECGFVYEECRRAPCIAPIVTFGTLVIIGAIIAVTVQNCSDCHHCH